MEANSAKTLENDMKKNRRLITPVPSQIINVLFTTVGKVNSISYHIQNEQFINSTVKEKRKYFQSYIDNWYIFHKNC